MTAPLLLHVFSTFATGGPQVRFAAVANRFGRRWRHAIVAMDGDRSARERLSPALDVTFPEPRLRKGDTFGNLRRCRSALRAWRPTALVTSNFGAIEWALANAWMPMVARHVHMEDGFGPEERFRQLPRRVWLRRLALRRATVVVPSATLQAIARNVWRVPERRLRLVANGVDAMRFGPATRPAGDGVVIGTVAALRPEKNIGRLLRAVAGAPPGVRLVVVGDGPDLARLRCEARGLGIAERVHFAGHVPDPAALYATFDLFALSSDTEQMPLSLLEAMAAGLPVVATDVGDVARMLATPNRPWVVPADDARFAAALADLAGRRHAWAAIGAANRRVAQSRFDQEAMFQAYAALWDGMSIPSTRANTAHWPALVSSQPNPSA